MPIIFAARAMPAQFDLMLIVGITLLTLMKPVRVPIRRIGNSRGVVIPKPLLHQAGLEDAVDLILEGDAIVLRKPAKPVRAGWAEASRAIAERGDDVLVMGEFANEEDLGSTW